MPNWKKVITSGSNAVLNEITASGAVSASTYYGDGSNLTGISGGSTDTGSLLTTASVSSNTITFTKGDSSTFDITVDTGSAGSDPFPYTGSAIISGSLEVIGNVTGSLTIEGSGSTLFEVNGSEGQLFSITDSLSGSLFAVSDVSGLPILEVFSDDTVKMGSFNNEAIIVTGSTAIASGSFSGSFQGDGSNLTGINTGSWDGVFTGSAVISGSLTITGSTNINANSTNIIEVTQASDLPTTLLDNTTYLVRGNVTIPGGSEITAGQFNAIMGLDRDKDKLTYSGTGNFITVTDETFLMQNLGLSSTNASSCILSASNVAASGYNNSRDEFLSIINCQFRNVAGNVMDVKGFDLVDFNNTTFFYCESSDFGCKFQDVSKLEISSCEFIRWFDETSIPTPSGYATCPMIELDVNNHASFGAVNISGCIIHPQQTQFAILVNSGSTTGFGTIAANAFVNVGLTTGGILGQSTYDSGSMLKYDVFGNQGLENSSAEAFITVTGNTTTTVLGRGNAVQVDFGGNENVRSIQRFGFDAVNEYVTYKGSKDIKVLIAGTLVGEKSGGGSETYTLDLRKDSGGGFTSIPGSSTEFTTSGGTVSITKNLIVNVSQNDNLAFFIRSSGGDDFTAQDLQLTITEV